MPIFYPESRISGTTKYCLSLNEKPCRQKRGYGAIGENKRTCIREIKDQNGFIIKHVRLGKKSEKQIESFFQAGGMHSGKGLLPARNAYQKDLGNHENTPVRSRLIGT